jgi:hypothetical protein
MATFLLLPPRELLEHALADFLARVLPGVPAPNDLLTGVLDQVAAAARDTFVVHREDLPETGDAASALREVFGAEPGDRVVEVGPPRAGGAATGREWVVTGQVSTGGAAR